MSDQLPAESIDTADVSSKLRGRPDAEKTAASSARNNIPGAPTGKRPNDVTPVGGNIFIDLGFSPDEAAELKRRSRDGTWKNE
jgi:hypothetical protein